MAFSLVPQSSLELGNQPSHLVVSIQSASWPRTAPSFGNLGDFLGCLDHLLFGVSIAKPAARKFPLETSSSSGTHELRSL